MCGGSFRTPLFVVTWPTGEFGGMGLEGAVKLGFRKELQALTDLAERKALYDKMVAQSYQRGKAVNMASHFELDEVIDPAETRRWIIAGLDAVPPAPERAHKKRPHVDTW
jgi:acetyl-CoA carboxylase carboxyltransferase component